VANLCWKHEIIGFGVELTGVIIAQKYNVLLKNAAWLFPSWLKTLKQYVHTGINNSNKNTQIIEKSVFLLVFEKFH
jgi:hypothetical protein